MKRHRVCIVWIEGPNESFGGSRAIYWVTYKVLKRGRKRERWTHVSANDELDAYVKFSRRMEEKGYRV